MKSTSEAAMFSTMFRMFFGFALLVGVAPFCLLLACGARSDLHLSSDSDGASSSPPLCFPGETVPCYEGPLGTEGIGACHGGVRTCLPDGSSFGRCIGDIVPSPESCATPEDDDCNGEVGPSMCPPPFTLSVGGYGEPLDIHVDAAGLVYVLGAFEGTLDFGNGVSLVAQQPLELFLVHIDTDGNAVWAKRFPFTGSNLDPAVAWHGSVIVHDDGIFISGAVSGAVDFGNGPIAGKAGFIARFDTSGNPQWAVRTNDFWETLDVDSTGHSLVVGRPDPYISEFVSHGPTHIFKLDPQGKTVWDRQLSASFNLILLDIAVDAEGAATFVGWLMGDADIGTGVVGTPSELEDSLFIGKVDTDGNPLWARAYRDPKYKYDDGLGFAMPYYLRPLSVGVGALASVQNAAFSVAIAKNGDAVVAGIHGGSVDFGGGSVFSDAPSICVVRFGPDGEHIFSRFAGGVARWMPPIVAIGPQAEIGVAAIGEPYAPWGSGLDFGGGKLPASLALATLDPNGVHVKSTANTPPGITGLCRMAIAAGGTYLTCTGGLEMTFEPQQPSVSGFFIKRLTQ